MTLLNFAVPNWQLTIGDWDITHLVSQFTLQRPRAEISTPYSWQGSLVLDESLNPDLLAESLDDLVNPQRWATGIYPIRIKIEGRLIATVRIKRYFYNEDTYTGEAELVDQLGLRDYESPPKDFEGLGFRVSRSPTPASVIVNKLVQMAGLASSVSVGGFFEVPPNKFSESYISLAQQICGERGYWIYCDSNEIIRAVAYRPGTVLFQRSRPQVKLFDRQNGLEIPAEIFRVAGNCEKIALCGSEDPIVNEEFETDFSGNKILKKRETIYPFIGNTRQIVIEESLSSIFPDNYPSNKSTVTSERITETVNYDSRGRLKKNERRSSRLLGVALPDDYPGNRNMISNAEIITEEYSNSPPNTASSGFDDGVLRSKVTTKTTLFRVDINGGTPSGSLVPIYIKNQELAIKEKTIESWNDNNSYTITESNKTPRCRRVTYKKLNYQRNQLEVNVIITGGSGKSGFGYKTLGELILKSTNRETNQSPPNWTTKEPDNPVDTVTVAGETRFYPTTFSPYYEKEFEISCSTLTTDNEAQQLASLVGQLQHQRYRSRLITVPPSDVTEWLDDTIPFSTVNIHNGSFIMDSPVIALDKKTMIFSFIGNYLGAIPIINQPPSIPDLPLSPTVQAIKINVSYNYLIEKDNSASTIYIYNFYAYGVASEIINSEYNYVIIVNNPMELTCFKG